MATNPTVNGMETVWEPQKKQYEFMSRPEYEVFYGGAAGGGKSDAVVIEALRQVDKPKYKAIIFRKTFPQLEDLILKSQWYYKKAFPKAKYDGGKHVWTFPSGAKIYFGSMPHRTSYLDYQGKSYAFIAFDELTQFSEEEYTYMMSRNRADGPNIRVYMRATGNPGGIGHGWVKSRFITAMPPNTTYVYETQVESPKGEVITVKRTRRFVPSSVFDNQILLKNDPNYLANLASLSERRKRQLLYGEWDGFEGQVFTEWRNNPEGYRTHKWSHVIEPFQIPAGWQRYRSYDWGYSKPFSMIWFAVSPDGVIYQYRELYGCTGTANEGVRWEMSKQAATVAEIENTKEAGQFILGVADPAIWDESRGKSGSAIEIFAKHGVFFDKGKNSRISGLIQVHNRLKFDENGNAMFYVFSNCLNTIRTIPNLIYSKTNIEDIDTDGEDHIYDCWRYLFMARPITTPKNESDFTKPKNPLEK